MKNRFSLPHYVEQETINNQEKIKSIRYDLQILSQVNLH